MPKRPSLTQQRRAARDRERAEQRAQNAATRAQTTAQPIESPDQLEQATADLAATWGARQSPTR